MIDSGLILSDNHFSLLFRLFIFTVCRIILGFRGFSAF